MATQSEVLTSVPPLPDTSIDITQLTKESKRTIGGLDITGVIDRDPWLNMLIYGPPGGGKTVLCGSAEAVEEMNPCLVADVEGGTFSLRALYPTVDVVRVTTWVQMQELYNELYRGKHGYKTIVLDSLTEIQRLSMLGIMKEVIKKEPERDPEVPSIREWGKNGEQTRRMIRAFRDLPMNVLFTALSIEEKDQKSGKIKHRPSLSGKMAYEVAGYMDVVGFMYTMPKDDAICRFMLSGTTDTHIAKDRTGSLPLVVENPSMASIHKHIFPNGERT